MDIHEYQAKELLAGFGVRVPKGGVAYSADQAVYRATEIGGSRWVVKAQIHSGARGKAGGIKLCASDVDVRRAAKELLGTTLVTMQTGPDGLPVHRVLVEEALPIARELYVGLVLDRKRERIVVVAHPHGGMEIEEIAQREPEAILRSEEHTSELQSRFDLVCRLLLEKKNKNKTAQRVDINTVAYTQTRLCLHSHLRCLSPHTVLSSSFFFNPTPTTQIYTLSLHDALPISSCTSVSSSTASASASSSWRIRTAGWRSRRSPSASPRRSCGRSSSRRSASGRSRAASSRSGSSSPLHRSTRLSRSFWAPTERSGSSTPP